MTTVYASIGNSDDKLSQQDWARFCEAFANRVNTFASRIYGRWFSAPDAPFQNACVAFEIHDDAIPGLQETLEDAAVRFGQDSIAWAVAPATRFLGPGGGPPAAEQTRDERAADVLADLGQRLARVRAFRKVSLRDAAAQAGVGFNTLARLEKGQDVSLTNAVAILRWLDGEDR
jgi:hypothetical protein